MKIELRDGILSVSEVRDLDGTNALSQKVRGLLLVGLQAIEIDLSQTEFLNCGGLGELIAIQKMALQQARALPVRVVNAPTPVLQLLELTRLHEVFEIAKR